MTLPRSKRKRTTLNEALTYRAKELYDSPQKDHLNTSDRLKIISEISEDLLQVTKKHFPKTRNLEYSILKSHLIIEHALTQFIRCSSHVFVELKDIKFSFSQKHEIAVLMGFGNGHPFITPSVELLNTIRNQIAHRFYFDRNQLLKLISINSDKSVDVCALTDTKIISFLKYLCNFICTDIYGIINARGFFLQNPKILEGN